jgi:hypothetical protein
MFYGITTGAFYCDTDRHHMPHAHAGYQGQFGVYSILDGGLLSGSLRLKNTNLLLPGLKSILELSVGFLI